MKKPEGFDFNEIVGKLRKMVDPLAETPEPEPGDDLGEKLAELRGVLDEVTAAQDEHTRKLNYAKCLINQIFEEVGQDSDSDQDSGSDSDSDASSDSSSRDHEADKPNDDSKGDSEK